MVMEWHTRQQYRDCVMGLGCQHAQICSLTMLHVSHPYIDCFSNKCVVRCIVARYTLRSKAQTWLLVMHTPNVWHYISYNTAVKAHLLSTSVARPQIAPATR